MLLLICEALDRAVMLREEIVRDGPTIRTKTGQIKEHPCLKHELSAMAYVSRGLQRLGLNFEAIQPIGRPTSYHGVKNAD